MTPFGSIDLGQHWLRCWFLIDEFPWYLHESNFKASAQAIIPHNEFENHALKITATSCWGQWVNDGWIISQGHSSCAPMFFLSRSWSSVWTTVSVTWLARRWTPAALALPCTACPAQTTHVTASYVTSHVRTSACVLAAPPLEESAVSRRHLSCLRLPQTKVCMNVSFLD